MPDQVAFARSFHGNDGPQSVFEIAVDSDFHSKSILSIELMISFLQTVFIDPELSQRISNAWSSDSASISITPVNLI